MPLYDKPIWIEAKQGPSINYKAYWIFIDDKDSKLVYGPAFYCRASDSWRGRSGSTEISGGVVTHYMPYYTPHSPEVRDG